MPYERKVIDIGAIQAQQDITDIQLQLLGG